MKLTRLAIPDVLLIEPRRFGDARGFFSEVWKRSALEALGFDVDFVQDNQLGCHYSVVGHSERRFFHGETNEVVSKKARAALSHSITPIICVGEPLEVREAGNHVSYTLDQVEKSLEGLSAENVAAIVIAYEPVWAIGTGKVATAQDAEEVASGIRKWISNRFTTKVGEQTRILYGGSVKASNIAEIMAESNVDGALIGGASLDPDEFVAICRFRLH